jgi:hypothetical protein
MKGTEGSVYWRRLMSWLAILGSLISLFVQCVRLYLREKSPHRGIQSLGALVQILNAFLGVVFEVFPSLHGKFAPPNASSEALQRLCRRRHLTQLFILHIMRAVNQVLYSYHPLVDMSSRMCQASMDDSVNSESGPLKLTSSHQSTCLDSSDIHYALMPPKISPLAQQLNAQTVSLLIERSAMVLFVINLVELPLFLFLDYRFVTLNGLFEPDQLFHGLARRALMMVALKLGELTLMIPLADECSSLRLLLFKGAVILLPTMLEPTQAGPKKKMLIIVSHTLSHIPA